MILSYLGLVLLVVFIAFIQVIHGLSIVSLEMVANVSQPSVLIAEYLSTQITPEVNPLNVSFTLPGSSLPAPATGYSDFNCLLALSIDSISQFKLKKMVFSNLASIVTFGTNDYLGRFQMYCTFVAPSTSFPALTPVSSEIFSSVTRNAQKTENVAEIRTITNVFGTVTAFFNTDFSTTEPTKITITDIPSAVMQNYIYVINGSTIRGTTGIPLIFETLMDNVIQCDSNFGIVQAKVTDYMDGYQQIQFILPNNIITSNVIISCPNLRGREDSDLHLDYPSGMSMFLPSTVEIFAGVYTSFTIAKTPARIAIGL